MVDCKKIQKLERGINILKDKFSSFEEKVYDDVFELRSEMETLRMLFNASNENLDHVINPEDVDSANVDIYNNIYGADEILRKMEDRSRTMLRSFAKEKTMIRDCIKKFEDDVEKIKKQHDDALSDLINASNELSTEINI